MRRLVRATWTCTWRRGFACGKGLCIENYTVEALICRSRHFDSSSSCGCEGSEPVTSRPLAPDFPDSTSAAVRGSFLRTMDPFWPVRRASQGSLRSVVTVRTHTEMACGQPLKLPGGLKPNTEWPGPKGVFCGHSALTSRPWLPIGTT